MHKMDALKIRKMAKKGKKVAKIQKKLPLSINKWQKSQKRGPNLESMISFAWGISIPAMEAPLASLCPPPPKA